MVFSRLKRRGKIFLAFFLFSVFLFLLSNVVWFFYIQIHKDVVAFVIIFTLLLAAWAAVIEWWIAGRIIEPIDEEKKTAENSAVLLIRRDNEFRRANEELEKEKEVIISERNKLSVILSGMSDAVIALDLQGNIVSFNKAAELLTGTLEKDAVGRSISNVIKLFSNEIEITSSEFCPYNPDGFEGIVYRKQDIKLLGQGKTEKFVHITSGQIKEGAKANLGCILTFYDITKEKQLEQMKLDFVSMAAHELRTPLTSIHGYLLVFLGEDKSNLTPDQLAFLNRINISTQQLIALVENLLNVSRIERGVFSIKLGQTDWYLIVQGIVNELLDRAKEKNQTLTLLPSPPDVPQVAVDKLRISEVVTNLVANAISYTAEGGSITVWIEYKDNSVITHVKDTGQGIPEEALPKLFTKFFRVWGKLEMGSKGTGLGLYIAKSIVTMHKGKIWVESMLGKGSTFSFSLPAATNIPTPPAQQLQ